MGIGCWSRRESVRSGLWLGRILWGVISLDRWLMGCLGVRGCCRCGHVCVLEALCQLQSATQINS